MQLCVKVVLLIYLRATAVLDALFYSTELILNIEMVQREFYLRGEIITVYKEWQIQKHHTHYWTAYEQPNWELVNPRDALYIVMSIRGCVLCITFVQTKQKGLQISQRCLSCHTGCSDFRGSIKKHRRHGPCEQKHTRSWPTNSSGAKGETHRRYNCYVYFCFII